MKKLFFRLFFLLTVLGFSENIFSQQLYKTIKGDIAITIKYNDTVLIAASNQLIDTIKHNDTAIIAASNQLIVVLDYETGKIIMRVAYDTFHTGIDSIDNKLKSLKGQELRYTGKIDIFINTKNKSQQKYNMTGMMTSAIPPAPAEGKGTVLCMMPKSSDTAIPSCMLFLALKFTLSGLGLTDIFKGADNTIQIDIQQSLLEKEKVN